MDDSAILFLLGRLSPYFKKTVSNELILCRYGNNQVRELSEKLKEIQEVLMDVEQKRVMDERVNAWLWNLQDIFYDLQDLLDEWDMKSRRSGLVAADCASLTNKVRKFFQFICIYPGKFMEHRYVARSMKKLHQRLINTDGEEKERFKFFRNLKQQSVAVKHIISTSFVDLSVIKGRDEDRRLLVEMLLPQQLYDSSSSITSEDSIEILSIVGAGGMGKTALAQLLFNDGAVKCHFSCNIWVCVSDPLDEIRLAKLILESVKKTNESVQMETLLQVVQESILSNNC